MAPEEAAACAVRRVELRVRIVGFWAVVLGWVKVAGVLSMIMAFEAVERVWEPIVITGLSPLRYWLPICSMLPECWVAVIVVEPRSRMASGEGVCVGEIGDVGMSCELDALAVGLIISLQSPVNEYV